jgi:uncharacterized protein
MKKIFAAAILATCLIAPAFGEDTIAPAKLALAKELIQVSGAQAMLGSPDMMADAMVGQVKKSAPGVDNDAIEMLKKITKEEFTASVPGLLENSAKIYARHFSEAEMHDMIAFYQSATGKRVVTEMPALMRESMQMSSGISQRIVQRFIQYMQERATTEAKKDTPPK